ncbi:MAG: hypothetical protein K2Y37_20550 [Pirellulales bacterium]|nr:hypothetical protein [Pirellulales bacterium]
MRFALWPVDPTAAGVGIAVSEVTALVNEHRVASLDRTSLDERAYSSDILFHVFPANDRQFLLEDVLPAMIGLVFELGRDLDLARLVDKGNVGTQSSAFSLGDGVVIEHAERQSAVVDLADQCQLQRPHDIPLNEKRVIVVCVLEPRQYVLEKVGDWVAGL